jgi:hypothetical protein
MRISSARETVSSLHVAPARAKPRRCSRAEEGADTGGGGGGGGEGWEGGMEGAAATGGGAHGIGGMTRSSRGLVTTEEEAEEEPDVERKPCRTAAGTKPEL